MTDLDEVNRIIFEAARERDFQLWILDAAKSWRQALFEGRDGNAEKAICQERLTMIASKR